MSTRWPPVNNPPSAGVSNKQTMNHYGDKNGRAKQQLLWKVMEMAMTASVAATHAIIG